MLGFLPSIYSFLFDFWSLGGILFLEYFKYMLNIQLSLIDMIDLQSRQLGDRITIEIFMSKKIVTRIIIYSLS